MFIQSKKIAYKMEAPEEHSDPEPSTEEFQLLFCTE